MGVKVKQIFVDWFSECEAVWQSRQTVFIGGIYYEFYCLQCAQTRKFCLPLEYSWYWNKETKYVKGIKPAIEHLPKYPALWPLISMLYYKTNISTLSIINEYSLNQYMYTSNITCASDNPPKFISVY